MIKPHSCLRLAYVLMDQITNTNCYPKLYLMRVYISTSHYQIRSQCNQMYTQLIKSLHPITARIHSHHELVVPVSFDPCWQSEGETSSQKVHFALDTKSFYTLFISNITSCSMIFPALQFSMFNAPTQRFYYSLYKQGEFTLQIHSFRSFVLFKFKLPVT